MKTTYHHTKTLLFCLLALFVLQSNAQKVEFETIEINYGDIVRNSKGIKLRGNFLIFSETTTLSIDTKMDVPKGTGDLKIQFSANGYDKKWNKYSSTLDYTYSAKGTNNSQTWKLEVKKDDEIYIQEISLKATDKNGNVYSATEPIINTSKKTSFAILLNGINSNNVCEDRKLNSVFMNETTGTKYKSIRIGLNNGKNTPTDLELALRKGAGKINGTYVWTDGHDQRKSRVVQPFLDSNGNWIFADSMAIEKLTPSLKSFEILYVSACGDSVAYFSEYKEILDNNKSYNYKVKMIRGSEGQRVQNLRQAKLYPDTYGTIIGGDLYVKDEATLLFRFAGFNDKGTTEKKVAICCVFYKTSNGGGGVDKEPWTWSSSEGMYTASYSFKGSQKSPVILTGMKIYAVEDNKDTIVYSSDGDIVFSLDGKEIIWNLEKTAKLKYYDSCNTKFEYKKLEFNQTEKFGISSVSIYVRNNKKSNMPNQMKLVVTVKDCKGTIEYVSVTMKYDEKSDVYAGGFNYSSGKDCSISLGYGEVAAYNKCNNKTVWSFDCANAKTADNGNKVVELDKTDKSTFFK